MTLMAIFVLQQVDPNAKFAHVNQYLPSEVNTDDSIVLEATSISSVEGENVRLSERVRAIKLTVITHTFASCSCRVSLQVLLVDGVEQWLKALVSSMQGSIAHLSRKLVSDINNGVPCEEWAMKYPTQLCRLGVLFAWTKECEASIAELKTERKALHYASKRWASNWISRLTPIMGRSSFRGSDELMLPYHRCRLEAMFTVRHKRPNSHAYTCQLRVSSFPSNHCSCVTSLTRCHLDD